MVSRSADYARAVLTLRKAGWHNYPVSHFKYRTKCRDDVLAGEIADVILGYPPERFGMAVFHKGMRGYYGNASEAMFDHINIGVDDEKLALEIRMRFS